MSVLADPSLRDKLTAVEADIVDLRAKRAHAVKARERARDAFAAVDGYDVESPEFRDAQEAVKAVESLDADLERKSAAQVGLLTLISGAGTSTRTDDLSVGDRDIVKSLTREPGRLLSAILSRRAGEIPRFRDDERLKAAPARLGTADVTIMHETDAVIDLLAPRSVALASGIVQTTIDGTKTSIPRFTELPVAGWVPEFGAFPKNAPGIQMVDVEPPKVGLISPLSLEVFDDLSPLTLAMLQTQILRAVALAFDHGILFGDGEDGAPLGVARTTGIPAVTGVPLTGLGAFAKALATLIGFNASPGALVMNPMDLGTLLQATESDTGAGSNVPLWKASIDSPSGLRLPYFNTPIWPTPACPTGMALLYDPSTIIAVLRRPADIALDPFYDLDHGIVGLRSYLRGDVVVGQNHGSVLIVFGTP